METSSRKRQIKRILAVAAVGVVVAAVSGLVWRVSAFYVGTLVTRAVYFATPFMLSTVAPLIVGVVVIAAAVKVWPDVWSRSRMSARQRRLRMGISWLLVVGMVVPAVWLVQGIRWNNRYGYETARPFSVEIVETSGPIPDYELRLSVPQARLQLRQALSGTAGRIGDVTYVANKTVPEYCATVLRSAPLGRVWTREVLCLDPETGRTRSGEFTGHVGSVEGLWSSKLGDQVASVRRGLVFDADDVYGYLTETGDPRLVVPVRYGTGSLMRRYDVPAGVVVFEADGSRHLLPQVAAGDIPGPVMSMGMAARIREAVNSREGFLVHRSPRRSETSLEGTNTAEGLPASDPNTENPSEFVLVRDGRLVFVTPLTPYGQSQTVVAYVEVPADTVTAGEMPTATVYRLEHPQASWQLITQRVTTLYDADIDWMATNEAGDDSNKSRVYEITPSATGQVTMTIGTGTQTVYRVVVDAGLDDQNRFGQICIYRFRTGELIRCDDSDADPTPVGALRGVAASEFGGSPSGRPSTTTGADLSQVPTRDLLDELERRLFEPIG